MFRYRVDTGEGALKETIKLYDLKCASCTHDVVASSWLIVIRGRIHF